MRSDSSKNKKSVSRVRSTVGQARAAGPTLHRLSVSAARSLVRPHTGFEAFVEPLARLVETYSGKIGMEGIDVPLMLASFADMQALEAQRADVAGQLAVIAEKLATIENTQLIASSTVWKQQLLIYSAARQAGRSNLDIDGAISPFEQFMKTGPRKPSSSSVATTP